MSGAYVVELDREDANPAGIMWKVLAAAYGGDIAMTEHAEHGMSGAMPESMKSLLKMAFNAGNYLAYEDMCERLEKLNKLETDTSRLHAIHQMTRKLRKSLPSHPYKIDGGEDSDFE